MQITDIKPLDKKRYEIFIDNELAFVLYKGELRHFGLHVGEDISLEDYEKITNEVLPKRALLRCGHLLEKRDYTESEIRQKLKMALYPDEAIDFAVEKVKGYGFVDDLRYAERLIECLIEKKSKNSIKTKLFQKGIKKDIIEKAFDNIASQGIQYDEDELIINLLNKRHYFDGSMDAKERAKQYNYLMSKGFSSEAIRRNLKFASDDY